MMMDIGYFDLNKKITLTVIGVHINYNLKYCLVWS